MFMIAGRMPLIRIGDCTLDRSDGTVVSGSAATRLEPKVLAVALYLIDRRGAVVPKEELFREIWGDTHVAPGALARTISVLRRALADEAGDPRYIETIPKRGYRWIAEVGLAAAPEPAPAPRPYRLRLAAALAASMLLTGPSPILLPRPSSDRTVARYTAGIGSPQFSNQTRAGNETAFAYYSEAVATHPNSSEAHAGLSRAYAFRANYLPNRPRWAADAIDAAHKAVELDPSSASALHALAVGHAQAGRFRLAARFYRRALDLCPENHTTRADLGITLMYQGRVAEAVTLFDERVAADNDLATYGYFANGLMLAGYLGEAAAVARHALTLEPYALEPQLLLARASLLQGHHDAARARLERLLEVWPDCSNCVTQLGLIDQLTGANQRAESRFLQARSMAASPALASLRLAQLWHTSGRLHDAAAMLSTVEAEARAEIDAGSEAPMPRWKLAAAAAVRGDRASAARWYARSIDAGRTDAAWDHWDPLLAVLRSSPEFATVGQRSDAEHRAAAALVFRSDVIRAALAQQPAPDTDVDRPGWPTHRRP
jgi:DNA-binding winged helix-turn-helix (wHTH) protein/Flp pilus assembly protein TadD